MTVPIEDYAAIGDTRSLALVSKAGSIDWLCWPSFDSAAVFCRLVDDAQGGFCRLNFGDAYQATRAYLPQSAILRTVFETMDGQAEVFDFMPMRRVEDDYDGPDALTETRIIRYVRVLRGAVKFTVEILPTFDFARAPHCCEADGDRVIFRSGDECMYVDSSSTLHCANSAAAGAITLSDGQRWYMALTYGQDTPRITHISEIERRLAGTTRYWESWSKQFSYRGSHPEAVLRSIITLKLLTYAPSGGNVAAPTTSLPEALPGNRNFDYRYTWLRDASFTVSAFLNVGFVREATEFLRYLRNADRSVGKDLQLLYGIRRKVTPEQSLDHLAGYAGNGPVRIGNAANEQTQLDIYGEFLMALDQYIVKVGDALPASVAADLPSLVENLAETVMRTWREPDSGIWELRTPPAQLLHSKAMCWVALDRAAAIAERVRFGNKTARWRAEAALIRAEYLARCWNETRQAYMQSYDGDVLDASVLRVVLFDAIDAADPKLDATIQTIRRELMRDGFVYRYSGSDAFDGREGAFTVCTMWLAACEAIRGNFAEAQALFDHVVAHGNDVGLFAEEVDPAGSGAQRGNFPQGFTHMGIVNNGLRIQRERDRRAAVNEGRDG